MNEATHRKDEGDPEQLERDIDRTRSDLGRTIDELENRLSPGQLLDQALGMARRHGGEFATNLGRSAQNNPVPMLLTGIGIAWMMGSSNEPRAAPRSDRAADAKDRMQSGARSAKSAAVAVSGKASRVKESVGDRMTEAGERARLQSDRVRQGLSQLLEDQPLVVGAIGIAIGSALGAALPRTDAEDRLMGEASDSATRSVKEKATTAYDEVKGAAADVAASRAHSQGRSGASSNDSPVV